MKKKKNTKDTFPGAAFVDYDDRAEWLNARLGGIGASEAGVILGYSNFMTVQDLWKEKVGKKEADDLSDNERVAYGNGAEEHLRALFALKNKSKYEVAYHPFRIYRNINELWQRATLDGELLEIETGRRGVWECKTAWINSKSALEEWNNRIPMKYYCQVLHQLSVTEAAFAALTAELIFPDGNSEIRNYTVERQSVIDDMRFVTESERNFWGYVKRVECPPVVLRL